MVWSNLMQKDECFHSKRSRKYRSQIMPQLVFTSMTIRYYVPDHMFFHSPLLVVGESGAGKNEITFAQVHRYCGRNKAFSSWGARDHRYQQGVPSTRSAL